MIQEPQNKSGLGNAIERQFLGTLFKLLTVPERLSTKDYAETYIWLTEEITATPGKMDCLKTPFMLKVMQCLDNPDVKIIVAKKSAQIAWTRTINNYLERIIATDPQPIMIAFPSEGLANAYAQEKLRPAIRNSPRLLEKIGNPDKCRVDFYRYSGGFIKLVSAASDNALTSTSAPILIAEEPDRFKQDLKGQGNAIDIFKQRLKTYAESKLIFGGTPVEEGFSNVDVAYEQSNKMVFHVPCNSCNTFHILTFGNLKCDSFPEGRLDPVYGNLNPETAYYECPHCLARWDDKQKELNVLEAIKYNDLGWVATGNSAIVGFAFNELMSSFPGSSLVNLASTMLAAEVEADKGKDGKLKSFTNNSKGLSYSPKTTNTSVEVLKAARIDYREKVVPPGGIVLTAGIDVQHNRFAIVIRAWGRNGNSWLIYWGEIYGYVRDPENPVWEALTDLCLGKIPHAFSSEERKISLPISAISIDSGDGNTAALVYSWVGQMSKVNPYTFATKGDTAAGITQKEIFTVPSDPDANTAKGGRKRLMETMGTHVYFVGVQLAKDEVLRKVALTGTSDRSYHYKKCRSDYEEQLLSNRKRGVPSRYELVSGKRDEVLDCEVLALHASRAINLHLFTEKHWQQAEQSILRASPKLLKPRENITEGLNI